MRAMVSEIDTLGSDLGFDTIPFELRSERPVAATADAVVRPAAERRPCRARVRPVARTGVRRDHLVVRHAATRARGVHPLRRVQRAQAGFAALAVTALVSALAVAGLLALAQLRSGDFDSQTTPAVPSAVQMAPAPAR
ncbi:hypothetical protein D7D52_35515 [Nocardia yunnanensis]|uniref:Uncharacterized protein n=1 Tax=Nocardia yunnanensis TaxID=2382165 RepID=A0A386ZL07_9NOCA|nr:hypothetical protein [Nocardia yunnanensis]AYF78261.1 hypothetical protein D7D52_35515 [Nocardia yunnanensis]